MWDQYVTTMDTSLAFKASTQNLLSIYAAATSILYGLGSGFSTCGVLAYCGIISKSGVSGKNFGFLFLIWALTGFLNNAIETYFTLSIMDRMWVMVLVAILTLTLANPDREPKAVEQIKKENQGNILENLKDLSVMIPVIFAAVHAYYMLVVTFPYVSNESDDPLDTDILKWMGMVFGPIGPIMFGILWDTSKM